MRLGTISYASILRDGLRPSQAEELRRGSSASLETYKELHINIPPWLG